MEWVGDNMIKEIEKYLSDLKVVIDKLDMPEVAKAVEVLREARKQNKQIFLMGNGGSAATANHFLCDFGKNAVSGDEGRFRIISVCTGMEPVTAYANDMAYESIFVEQLKNLFNDGDYVLAISASGNSMNVINAVNYAKERNGTIIGLTGGDGGKLRKLSDVKLHVECDVIEQVEDIHMIFEHILVFLFKHNKQLLD
jgi:D-sedoheptulose 7-phosphate isomerase